MRLKLHHAIALIFLFMAGGAAAQTAAGDRHIKIEGRKSIVVNTTTTKLGDIAEVSSARIADDEAVIALKKLEIEHSPAPGKESTISASRVLEKMKGSGVNLDSIIYTFPRVITVSRATRAVTAAEIQALIEEYFKKNGKDATVRNINYNNDMFVPPGTSELEAVAFNTARAGQYGFNIRTKAGAAEQVRFDVSAVVDEWADLPVAKRSLSRGSRVQGDDIMMARMNISSLPADLAHQVSDVIGHETSAEISYGEVFRKNKLAIPAVITAGSKVTMVYKAGFLQATATGIALDNGIMGQEIRIRNENSKKIISGKVIEPGMVGVKQ